MARLRIDRLFVIALAASAAWLVAAGPACAVIEALTPLAQFIDESDEIVVAKVEKFDSSRPVATFKVTANLRGTSKLREFPVNLKATKPEDTKQLVERLADGVELVLFVTHAPFNKNQDVMYAYTSGTWFQVIGQRDESQSEKGRMRWGFTHLEPYLPRTFHGPTEKLRETIAAVVAGKQKAPAVDPKVKPGIGPPISEQAVPESASPQQ